jgi:nucleoside-diphosphate-sugar epimerase
MIFITGAAGQIGRRMARRFPKVEASSSQTSRPPEKYQHTIHQIIQDLVGEAGNTMIL